MAKSVAPDATAPLHRYQVLVCRAKRVKVESFPEALYCNTEAVSEMDGVIEGKQDVKKVSPS